MPALGILSTGIFVDTLPALWFNAHMTIGSIVMLISGGPKMTVKSVDTDANTATCVWFTGDTYFTEVLDLNTLVVVNQE